MTAVHHSGPSRRAHGGRRRGASIPLDSTAAPPAGRLRDHRSLPVFLVLWFLALSHRLFFMVGNVDRSWPFPVFYEGDAETFYHYAQAILRGQTYDAGIPFHPPAFPYFLAFWHGLLGDPVPQLTLRIVLAVVYSLHVPLLWILLKRDLGRGPALAGALLAVWSFGLAVISVAAVSEGLYLLFLLGAFVLFRQMRRADEGAATGDGRPGGGRRPSWVRDRGVWTGAAFGCLLGMVALTRAEGLGIAILLIFWGLLSSLRRRRQRRPSGGAAASGLRPWVTAAAVLVLTLAPWTVRNAVTLARVNEADRALGLEPLPVLVVTTAYGPLNFALANHEGAPGYFTRTLLTSGLHTGVLNLRDPQHRHAFLHGFDLGAAYIRSHPGDFLRLVGRKLAILARSLRLGWTQWDLPGGLRGTRYPVDLFAPDAPWAILAHLALLLAGGTLLVRRWRGESEGRGERERHPRHAQARGAGGAGGHLALTTVYVAYTIVVTAAYFGYVRQGVLVQPLLFGIEGMAIAALAERVGERMPGVWRRPLLGIPRSVWVPVAVIWMVGLAGSFQDRNYSASGETAVGSEKLNRDSIMRLERLPSAAEPRGRP